MSTSSAPAGGPDVISDPPVVMTVWAWPKHPFGKNSGGGCHDATALRSFPEGNLNIETDIRWGSTARREPGTVFGVLTHHANTNQEKFGVGNRYYLPSAEDVSQVACLNLINTPNPANPNWLAIKVRLAKKERTELARLTPPEILAMLRTHDALPGPVGEPEGENPVVEPKRIGKAKGKNIDARMMKVIAETPESSGWSAREWGAHLGCSHSTIIESTTWTERLDKVRALNAADGISKFDRSGTKPRGRRKPKHHSKD